MSIFILLICTIVTFTACGSKKAETTTVKTQNKVKVVVSFNAMREISTAI